MKTGEARIEEIGLTGGHEHPPHRPAADPEEAQAPETCRLARFNCRTSHEAVHELTDFAPASAALDPGQPETGFSGSHEIECPALGIGPCALRVSVLDPESPAG